MGSWPSSLCDVKDEYGSNSPRNCQMARPGAYMVALMDLTDEPSRRSPASASLWRAGSPLLFLLNTPKHSTLPEPILWSLSAWEKALRWQTGYAWHTLGGCRDDRVAPGWKIRPESLFNLGVPPGQVLWSLIQKKVRELRNPKEEVASQGKKW